MRTGKNAPPLPADLSETVRKALQEDVGSGDLTAELIPTERRATAEVVSREPAVLCGIAWFEEVFEQLDPQIATAWNRCDGALLGAGETICRLRGSARHLLTGERTALNFLQTLSATATRAREYADLLEGTGVTVLDTRKTLPGLRLAQKYAVLCGGGRNHRLGLYDGILIKENHIEAAGSIEAAVSKARRSHPAASVEVEVESLSELEEALAAGPDIVMLDNFDLESMRQAVELTAGRLKLEASGNVTRQTLSEIAATGVDYVSVGALTKDVQAIDFSMRFRSQPE